MRISTLLETNTTPSSDPAANQSEQAPKFGRDPHVLEDEQLDETTAGSIATGEPANMGVQRRGKGSIFQGVKTSKKFANSASVKEGVAEDQLEEYGDTAKGQKMLAKVHHRAADRVTSKQADKDPAYARKAQKTQDRAWERLKDVAEGKEELHAQLQSINQKLKLMRGGPVGEPNSVAFVEKRKALLKQKEQILSQLKQGVAEGLNEFAQGNGSNGGNYLQALASAWYNHDIGMLKDIIKQGGSPMKRIIDAQEAVEKILARGIHCGDGKVRKYNIDYNPSFDGVVIFSDDYYEHGDAGGDVDNRTGRPWGPYDYIEFKDADLNEGVAEARPEPEQDQMDANRRAALRREREPHGSDKIDAMLAKRNAERREYEQTGNFWLKQKDTQEHLSDAFVGKAAANQAALELLKQRPELKGNLVITAWGPGEQPTNEALKPEALSALQTAKQTIQQKREQDIASWEQDFRRNFAKKRGMDVPQQQAQEPQSSQVAFPGEKHKDLQTRMTGLNAAVEKQKYLDYLTFKAEQRGLMNPGLEADIDTSMYIKDGAKDNYQALNQKLDKSIEKLKQRMGIHKIAYKKPKVMEDELSEEQIMAKELFKRLELFNKPQDHELGDKPSDKDIITKEDKNTLPKEFIEKSIYRVLLRAYPRVVQQYGMPIVQDAISNVANMHQGMEEISAQEAVVMLHQVVSQLKTHLHMREEKQRLDPKCWKGYKKQGTKMKGDTRVNNCVKIEK